MTYLGSVSPKDIAAINKQWKAVDVGGDAGAYKSGKETATLEFGGAADTPSAPDVEPWDLSLIRDRLFLRVSFDVPITNHDDMIDAESAGVLELAVTKALKVFEGKTSEMRKVEMRCLSPPDDTPSSHSVYELVIPSEHRLIVDQWLYQAGRIVLAALREEHGARVLQYLSRPSEVPLSVTHPGREYTTQLVYSNGQCEYLHVSDEEDHHA